MGCVWEWVKNITLVVILFSFIEILLPGSNMKKYLKFIFSLAILAMMVSPLAALGGGDVAAALGGGDVAAALERMPVSGQYQGGGQSRSQDRDQGEKRDSRRDNRDPNEGRDSRRDNRDSNEGRDSRRDNRDPDEGWDSRRGNQDSEEGRDRGQAPNDQAIRRIQTKQIQEVYRERLAAGLWEELKEKFPGISIPSVEIYINNKVRSKRLGCLERVEIIISDPDYEKAVRDYAAHRLQIEKRSVIIALSGE